MQHFCRSMMGYKNLPIFTPWMSSSKSISWLVQQYLPSDVVCACIKYNSSKFIEALFLYNCTSRWSCMYIMSVHYHPKGRYQIKKWTKTSVFITCHNHLFGIVPRKSILTKKTLYILELSPQIGVITFVDLFIAALMQGAPTLFHRYLLWSHHVKTCHFVFSLYDKWSANKPCLPRSKMWHILDVS